LSKRKNKSKEIGLGDQPVFLFIKKSILAVTKERKKTYKINTCHFPLTSDHMHFWKKVPPK